MFKFVEDACEMAVNEFLNFVKKGIKVRCEAGKSAF